MNINPKQGIDQLLFGMKQKDVSSIYGNPDKEFNDDEGNIIWIYNQQKWRLTFYEDENFRLGYIISSNPELQLFGHTVTRSRVADFKKALESHGFIKWEKEDFDLTENHFDETNWLILQAEFGEITKIEIGAIINDKDEFDWKFPKK